MKLSTSILATILLICLLFSTPAFGRFADNKIPRFIPTSTSFDTTLYTTTFGTDQIVQDESFYSINFNITGFNPKDGVKFFAVSDSFGFSPSHTEKEYPEIKAVKGTNGAYTLEKYQQPQFVTRDFRSFGIRVVFFGEVTTSSPIQFNFTVTSLKDDTKWTESHDFVADNSLTTRKLELKLDEKSHPKWKLFNIQAPINHNSVLTIHDLLGGSLYLSDHASCTLNGNKVIPTNDPIFLHWMKLNLTDTSIDIKIGEDVLIDCDMNFHSVDIEHKYQADWLFINTNTVDTTETVYGSMRSLTKSSDPADIAKKIIIATAVLLGIIIVIGVILFIRKQMKKSSQDTPLINGQYSELDN